MAITPRTILSSPAPATMAAVSLLAVTALGTLAYKVADQHAKSQAAVGFVHAADAIAGEQMCAGMSDMIGPDRSAWSEADWVVYTNCFEQKHHSPMAVRAASQGLGYYPTSEVLHNMKGYHQIVLGQHAEAVATLERGLAAIGEPTNGVMENNLAWASLWAPRELELEKARELYQRALRHDRNSCETLHTGLWVEYAVSERADGIERYDAYKRFLQLREAYKPCMGRAHPGDWNTVVEVVGAAVLFDDIDESFAPHRSVARVERDGQEDLSKVTEVLQKNNRGMSIDALCREAMPIASTHHLCVDKMSEAIEAHRAKATRVNVKKKKAARTSGGGGCAWAAN